MTGMSNFPKEPPVEGLVECLIDGVPGELRTHEPSACSGRHCAVHNPSKHPLSSAPLNWRSDRGLMERICEHGVGHPDPDHLFYVRVTHGEKWERVDAVHGCCGCCQ